MYRDKKKNGIRNRNILIVTKFSVNTKEKIDIVLKQEKNINLYGVVLHAAYCIDPNFPLDLYS